MSYLGTGPGRVYLPPPGNSIGYDQLTIAAQNALAGMRNKIINGNFDWWQRATSFAAAVQAQYTADRWAANSAGTTMALSKQSFTLGQTAVPGEPEAFMRVTTASVAGANNLATLYQVVENVRTFAAQQSILSFWAKADASRPMALEFFQNFGTGGSPSGQVNQVGVTKLQLSTLWQQFFVPVTIPSIAGKTLGTGGNDGVAVRFWFDAGSAFNGFTNSMGQQSGTFDIAKVQWEVGNYATPFEQRFRQIELALCQRYFEKSYAASVSPGSPSGPGRVVAYYGVSGGWTNNGRFWLPFKVSKRGIPASVTIYADSNGAAGQASDGSGINYSVGLVSSTTEGFEISNTAGASKDGAFFNWAANAEL